MKKQNVIHICKQCKKHYQPISKKSVFCSESCRGEHGRNNRRERDKEFNTISENQKKWYLTLLKFKSGSIVDLDTFRQFGLDRFYLPPSRYNSKKQVVYSFGAVTLLQLHDDNYEIIHDINTPDNLHYKSPDSKPIVLNVEEKTPDMVAINPELNKDENFISESAKKIIAEQQAKITYLEVNAQQRIDKDKLDRQTALLSLIKRESINILELLKFNPIVDTWNGIVIIDGFVFKHFFMRPKEYRYSKSL
ncbi:MAG: hypothetical protein JNJ40_15385 [Bacteroidia bacterium]|nr:hypothetical protein [Bacteroidia bacterium]